MKYRSTWIVLASLALASNSLWAIGMIAEGEDNIDWVIEHWSVDAEREYSNGLASRLESLNGQDRHTIIEGLVEACELFDLFLQVQEDIFERVEAAVPSGVLRYSEFEYSEFVESELQHLSSLPYMVRYEVRSLLWRVYYAYPDGIPVDLLDRENVVEARDRLCDVVYRPRPQSLLQWDWWGIGRGVVTILGSGVLGAGDIPIIATGLGAASLVVALGGAILGVKDVTDAFYQ